MTFEVIDQRKQEARDVILKNTEATKLYKVTIIVDPIGRNSEGVWFVAYVHSKKTDQNITTYSGCWGCKSTGVKFNRANPDSDQRKLDSREYWKYSLDILETYLREKTGPYDGPRPTRFERINNEMIESGGDNS
jgi:hypothetical protein